MKKKILKCSVILIYMSTPMNALDDDNKDLNLITPTTLNRIEGMKSPLEAVNKQEVTNVFSSSKNTNSNIESSTIDVSNYAKVKLIDVVLETLSRTDLLKSAREKVIQYELKLKDAMADYYPIINAEYNYGKTRSTPSGEEFQKFKYFNDNNFRVVLKQNIYSGGATFNNVRSVEKKLEVAKNQYKTTLEKEIKKAIKAYFGVVFTSRSVMVNERNMKKLKKILEIVTIKYDNGAASIGDITSIKANVANAMTKLVKVNSKFIESLRYYEYIVGRNFEKTLPYEKNFDVNISNFDELYKRALENNKELVNYYKTIEDEKFIQKKAKANFRPKVDLELSYKKSTEAEDLEADETDINGKINISYNIFNGGKDKNKVLTSNSKIRDLNYKLSEEKKKLKWNLSKVYTSIVSVSQALESTITEVKASRKMVSSYWDAFKLGEQDLNTLLQGQRQLNTAETEYVNYEKSNITDFFNILELSGDLASFFDVDPESSKFIDFTKSDYKVSVFPQKGDSLGIDLKTGEVIKSSNEKEFLEKEEKDENIKDIPFPIVKNSINENINKFLKEFISFDDDSYMIEISSFGNIYNSFDFIKENKLDKNSFSYDIVNAYNIETRIAHNNFKTIQDAKEYLKTFKEKNTDRKYKVKKVKDIKALYNKYIDGLKVEVEKPKTKIKIVEKIRQAVKKEEFKTNTEFKNKFLDSKDTNYTINISSFTNLDKLEEFVLKNKIYDESFFFKYGDNGQLIKLVSGVYENYNKTLEDKVNSFKSENKKTFPIVERISFVKKQYQDNFEFNIIKKEKVEYEYINLSKEEAKKNLISKDSEAEEIDRVEIENINKVDINNNNELTDFEKKFLAAPKDNFSIFLASLDTIEDAESFISNHNLEETSIIVFSNSGKMIIMSGVYESSDEGDEGISKLSDTLKKNKPFLQRIFRTQESYFKNNPKVDNINYQDDQEFDTEKDELTKLIEEKKLEEQKKQAAIEKEKNQEEIKEIEAEELRLEKIEEEKTKKENERLEKEAEEKKQEEIKQVKAEELRLKKEKAQAEAKEEAEKEKIAEEKRLKELKKQEEQRVAEEKKAVEVAKLEEDKRIAQLEKEKELSEEEVNQISNFEKKFLKAPKDYYSIFLASLDTKEDAQAFVRKHNLENKSIIVHSNSNKMIVMTGVYSNRTKASLGMSKLDNRLKRNKPFLQKIFRTQESYLKNNLNIDSSNESKKEEIIEASIMKKQKIEEEKKAKIIEEKRLEELKKQEEQKKAKKTEVIKKQKTTVKKVVETPYSKKLISFKKKFNSASKKNYTLKLTSIDSNRVKWYAQRFGLDPYYIVAKNGKKSTIYYGVFTDIEQAKEKAKSLHPLIQKAKPFAKQIGTIR